MENSWEEIKKKKAEHLEKNLLVYFGKLEKIRSNRISLEIIRGLTIDYRGQKKPLKTLANLSISANHELVIRVFEPKLAPSITKKILDEQLGYKLERSNKGEIYFSLLPITKEIRTKLIHNVKEITEEGKASFRRVRQEVRDLIKKNSSFSQDQKRNYENQTDKLIKDYQDKLVAAEEKKIRELNF